MIPKPNVNKMYLKTKYYITVFCKTTIELQSPSLFSRTQRRQRHHPASLYT